MSAGTGRNLPYYKYDQLNSLTLTDSSKYMLWHANKKYQEKYASKAAALPVSFLLSDAQQLTAPAAAAAPSNTDAVARRRSAQGLLLPHWYQCPDWSIGTGLHSIHVHAHFMHAKLQGTQQLQKRSISGAILQDLHGSSSLE